MNRFLLGLCALWLAAIAGTATAATHGVVAGLGLEWYGSGNGSSANTIYINEGNGYIDGTAFSYATSTSYGVPSGLKGGVTLAASTVYYIYMICASTPAPLLSTVTPNSDGHPSGNLSDASDCGSNSNDTHGVFVGSILTDSNKNVIPFARIGDEVRLMPATGATIGLAQGSWSVPIGSGLCTAGTITFSEFPASASALIAEADTTNDTVANFGIMQPTIACSSGGGLSWNPQYEIGPELVWEDLVIKTASGGVIHVALPSGADTNDELILRYYGYVEPLGHLVF